MRVNKTNWRPKQERYKTLQVQSSCKFCVALSSQREIIILILPYGKISYPVLTYNPKSIAWEILL